MRILSGVLALGTALGVAGCTTTPQAVEDPYEDFNRSMYAFNDGLDRIVLEPAAKGYRAVTTETIRSGVTNFVRNLKEPVTFANLVLQGRPEPATQTAGRFLLNSTVGVAGLFDVAGAAGVKRQRTDFGVTLGRWGVAAGPYLVLPVIGSTTPRDLSGSAVDNALDPLSWATFNGATELRITRSAFGALSARESLLETGEDLRSMQTDPYSTVKRFYVRGRSLALGKPLPEQEDTQEVSDFELDF